MNITSPVDDQLRPTGDTIPNYQISVSDRLAGQEIEELWESAQDASVFNHPSWWEAARRSFGRRRQLIAFSVHHQGQLVGYWPWWVKHLRARDGWARVLEPVAARPTDYVAPLVRAWHAPEVIWEIILKSLKREMGLRTIVFCPKTIRNKYIGEVIGDVFPANRHLIFRQELSCPMLEIESDYEQTQVQWSRSHRSNIRRKTKRLASKGKIELHIASNRQEILEATDRLVTMHRINWNARGQRSEFDTLAARTFVESVTANIPEKLLHISELRLDGKTVSSKLCFLDNNRLLMYKPTFRIDMARYSPGFVHDQALIRWCCDQGVAHYDLLQGTESYKLDLATTETMTDSYAISHRTAYPIWLWNAKIRKLAIRYRL